MELMIAPLKRYADFYGRSRRAEYWLFLLFRVLVYGGLFLISTIITAAGATANSGAAVSYPSPTSAAASITLLLIPLAMIAMLIPGLAVSVRRIHDIDQSGWWLLLAFVPFGGFVILVFDLIDGTQGANRYGPDPKGRPGYQPMTPSGPTVA